MIRLLVVCLGNICRSPMAEGALHARIGAAGLGNRVEVDSCRTGDWHVGNAPDARAIGHAAGRGVDIAGLKARSLAPDDDRHFDVLPCADTSTRDIVRIRRPEDASAVIERLLDWSGGDPGDVPDPCTGGPADFETAWTLVDAAAGRIARTMDAPAAADRA